MRRWELDIPLMASYCDFEGSSNQIIVNSVQTVREIFLNNQLNEFNVAIL
jgi:hypothetical protein